MSDAISRKALQARNARAAEMRALPLPDFTVQEVQVQGRTYRIEDRSIVMAARAVYVYNLHACNRGVASIEADIRRNVPQYVCGYMATGGYIITYSPWDDGSIYVKASVCSDHLDLY